VVDPAGDVLVEELLHGRGPELAAPARGRIEQEFGGERPQLAAEPGRERDAEARLAAARDLGRQPVGECLAERRLPLPARELKAVRERDAELEDAPVEEWRAQLE